MPSLNSEYFLRVQTISKTARFAMIFKADVTRVEFQAASMPSQPDRCLDSL